MKPISFQLKLAPVFRRQRKALLTQNDVPPTPLPASVEESLSGFHRTESTRGLGEGRLWRESLRAVRPLFFKAAAISLVSSAGAAAATLAATQILKPAQTLQFMWMTAVLYCGMNVMAHTGTLFSGRLRCWIGLGTEAHLVSLISRKLLRLSSLAAARQSSGNLKTLITSDVRNVGQFLDNATRNLIPALAAILVIAPLLLYFTGLPGLFGLVVMAAVLPISLGLNRISTRYQTKSQGELDNLTSLVGEWVKNVRLVRYLSWDEAFTRDVSGSVRKFMTVSVMQHFMACLIYGLSISWWMVSATGVVLLSWWLDYPLDMIGFFGSLWLLTFLSGYFNHLPNTIRLYSLAGPSIKRIAKLLAEEEQADHLRPGPEVDVQAIPKKVIFDNVSFQYPGGKLAVRNLSIEIPLHDQIAIIGEVGSGKTTFLKLLCGELPPTEGRIVVAFDNGQIHDLWSHSAYPKLREHLAYVPQEPFVSSDLFHMNISLSSVTSHEDIVDAAYWAELETDLAAFPEGLSQELGESGINLSGGQRQRLNLARAFFSRRNTMILDDTLSAMDPRTEAALMERLVSRGKGFVLVTHRTGELFRVGEVVVMQEGRVVERGEPQQLASDADSHFTRVLRAYEEEPVDG